MTCSRIIALGAEVNAHTNPDGKTLLHGAAEEGNALCLEVCGVFEKDPYQCAIDECGYMCAFLLVYLCGGRKYLFLDFLFVLHSAAGSVFSFFCPQIDVFAQPTVIPAFL